jgi:CRISPR-associated protein (TIGR02584 family)
MPAMYPLEVASFARAPMRMSDITGKGSSTGLTELARYPRRILLAVTGLSPQIVTETIYALAVTGKPAWVPTEIRIITTRRGAEEAQRAFLSDEGWFHRLCADYRLPEIAFGPENLHVIRTPGGAALDDILGEADNAAIADFITEQVREITADPNASLHVSIAGGRKTMGFYVGYALSLFGREQDRLSHVLVPPALESRKDFFYPAPGASDTTVYLGPIPFVRLRDGLPGRLLEGRARFSEAVAEAQKVLPPVALYLDPATRTVTAGSERIVLERPQFALYWMMAERCLTGRGGVHWSDRGVGEELLGFHRRLVNVHSRVYEKTEEAYQRFTKDNFDPDKAHVNAALKRALGDRRASPYLIGRLDPIVGTRYHRFGLSLSPEAIVIVPSLRGRRKSRG